MAGDLGLVRPDGQEPRPEWDAKIDPNARVVSLTHHGLTVQPVTLRIPFGTIKSIAATVLQVEVDVEEKALAIKRAKGR